MHILLHILLLTNTITTANHNIYNVITDNTQQIG